MSKIFLTAAPHNYCANGTLPVTKTSLLFFAGSARLGSFNARLAKLGAMVANANGITATFVDLGDYPMPLYDGDHEAEHGIPDNARKLEAVMRLHQGVMIMAPEYNASITPLLKNTLDWVSRLRYEQPGQETVFQTRVFALAGASPGGTGAMRGLFTVRHLLEHGLGAIVLPEQFLLPKAATAFDDDGHLTDKDAQDRFKAVIEKLARAAHVLHGD